MKMCVNENASKTWIILEEESRRLQVFQMRCQRSILGVSCLQQTNSEHTVREACCKKPTIAQ